MRGYRGSSLKRNRLTLGLHSRPTPKAPWWSYWGVRFLISEVPLYEATGQAMDSPSGHPLSSNASILSEICLWVCVPCAFSALMVPLSTLSLYHRSQRPFTMPRTACYTGMFYRIWTTLPLPFRRNPPLSLRYRRAHGSPYFQVEL